MSKFMVSHTMPANAMKCEDINQVAKAAQNDPVVKPYRSFINLSEGKGFCIMEAPNKNALEAWFKKVQLPWDFIFPVELEGEGGVIKDYRAKEMAAGK